MAKTSCLLLTCLALLMAMAGATQFKIGGQMGWTVPDTNGVSYNQWAGRNRFQIGDSLLFVYPADKDSVLRVDKEAYDTCNTATYLEKFEDGNTVFIFNRSGPFYFISGVEASCLKNESVAIVVLADRSNRGSGGAGGGANPPSQPPPASSTTTSPPPPPGSSGATPSGAAPAEGSTAPPPPPPPPSQSGVPAKVVGFMGSFGYVFGLLSLAL